MPRFTKEKDFSKINKGIHNEEGTGKVFIGVSPLLQLEGIFFT